uniref:Serine/threonine-protein kinase Haspin n=2 Tax=Solanum TaxID=4107 RepID=M1BK61_SOLTU
MTSRSVDLWAELIAAEQEHFDRPSQQIQEPNIAVVYRRQKPHSITPKDAEGFSIFPILKNSVLLVWWFVEGFELLTLICFQEAIDFEFG